MTMNGKVLILAAHGSSHPAAANALEGFAARVRGMLPGARVLLAHTAAPRPGVHPGGKPGSGLQDVLDGLPSDCEVAVLSLHVIAGGEYDRMREALLAFSARTGRPMTISPPLLGTVGDAPAVAAALAEGIGPLAQGECAVLMGHGTTHEAQELYRALAGELDRVTPCALLGVLEAADPDDPLCIEAMARRMEERGIRSVRLVPFLTVAGRHAHKDLAGEKPESWKSVLTSHGMACEADLAGLVEREAFARLWLALAGRLMQA